MYDLIIVGAGIAGQTAAIYAARKRMNFLLLTRDWGINFLESGDILNYPGILKTTGMNFSAVMKKQLEFNRIEPKEGEEVTRIEGLSNGFAVITARDSYQAKAIIIATGSQARKLKIPGESQFSKKGITYCSICDGPLFSGMDVAIIGGGNSALEAADSMKDIAAKVYLVVLGETLEGHEYLQEKVKDSEKIEILFNAQVREILGDKFVSGIRYEQQGKEKTLNVRGAIIEIGRVPNTAFLKGLVELEDDGHILIDCQMHTTVPGIFAAGDCAAGHEYQYVIAAGQGCMALLKVAKYLANKK